MAKNDFEQLRTIAQNYLDKNKNNASHTNQPAAQALIKWVEEKQRPKVKEASYYLHEYFSMSSALNSKYQELLDWKTVINILHTHIQQSKRFSPLLGISARSTLIDKILRYFNQRLGYLAESYCFEHIIKNQYYPPRVEATDNGRAAPAKSFHSIFRDMFYSLDRTRRFMQQDHPKKQSLTDGPDPYPSITDSHL